MRERIDELYEYCCKRITFREQQIIFGTMGLKNILQKYNKEDALDLAKTYVLTKDIKYGR